MKRRLDQRLIELGMTKSRSQAASYIRLGQVELNGKLVTKPGFLVGADDKIKLAASEQYVSRAGLKLASVAEVLKLNFKAKVVLDIGSSTGGFTDYALRHGAKKVLAVDVGTDQMDPLLRQDQRVELHEKTDIRDFKTTDKIDIMLADLSFISLREILPSVVKLADKSTQIVVMVKPQFEAVQTGLKHKGVIKNERIRRDILKDFESWVAGRFVIVDKADSHVAGAKGNLERFYLLHC